MTPITSPPRPTTGTARSDWNFSSSSSGKYFVRGSDRALSRMNAASPPFPALHDDLPRLPLVRRRRRPELEPLPVLREQVHEAGVDAAALRHETHDRAKDLGQLERRRNRRDDLVKRSLACPQRHVKADRKLVALESPASDVRLRRRDA